jgi:hypothetical protein
MIVIVGPSEVMYQTELFLNMIVIVCPSEVMTTTVLEYDNYY